MLHIFSANYSCGFLTTVKLKLKCLSVSKMHRWNLTKNLLSYESGCKSNDLFHIRNNFRNYFFRGAARGGGAWTGGMQVTIPVRRCGAAGSGPAECR